LIERFRTAQRPLSKRQGPQHQVRFVLAHTAALTSRQQMNRCRSLKLLGRWKEYGHLNGSP
jgi:hypothetical protein